MSYLQNPGYLRVTFAARMHGRPWSAGAAWSAWYDIRREAGDMIANSIARGAGDYVTADLDLWRACARRMDALRIKMAAARPVDNHGS